MNFENLQKYRYQILVAIVIICVVVIVFRTMKKEGADDTAPATEQEMIVTIPDEAAKEPVMATEPARELAPTPVVTEAPREISPADLLPSSAAVADFENKFPTGEGEATDKNFLIAGYNIGINTVGSSLKNANQQLRSDPFIPRKDVGPWNQSTIMASDLTNRKSLNIS